MPKGGVGNRQLAGSAATDRFGKELETQRSRSSNEASNQF
jgi:hypothetical protein